MISMQSQRQVVCFYSQDPNPNQYFLQKMLNELIDHQIDKKKISLRQKICKNQHPIDKLCIAHNCHKHTAHCSHSQCPQNQQHLLCPKIQLQGFEKLMEQQTNVNKQFIIGLNQIMEEKIEDLRGTWLQFIKQVSYCHISTEDRSLFDRLFIQERKKVKGCEVEKLFKKWLKKKLGKKNLIPICLKQFKIEMDKILNSIKNLRHSCYNQFLTADNLQIDNIDKLSDDSFCLEAEGYEIFDLDSFVIKNNDKEYPQKVAFIAEAIGNPKGFQRIYRGSQHKFSSTQFHKHCDGVSNTLTLVKTNFGKTIGGYTPLPWKSTPEGVYFADQSIQSCLLQVDTRQKLRLLEKDKAICCLAQAGPLFGSGHDLAIYDKCNLNNYSYAHNHGSYSFSSSNKDILKGSTQGFSGGRKNSSFMVQEYEVFRVVFDH